MIDAVAVMIIARVPGIPQCPKMGALHRVSVGSLQVELAKINLSILKNLRTRSRGSRARQ